MLSGPGGLSGEAELPRRDPVVGAEGSGDSALSDFLGGMSGCNPAAAGALQDCEEVKHLGQKKEAQHSRGGCVVSCDVFSGWEINAFLEGGRALLAKILTP
jgi:hypothetical protein